MLNAAANSSRSMIGTCLIVGNASAVLYDPQVSSLCKVSVYLTEGEEGPSENHFCTGVGRQKDLLGKTDPSKLIFNLEADHKPY